MLKGTAKWTCDASEMYGNLWYVALDERAEPPYLRQVHVEAIIDIDLDGRLAGIEIVDSKMPEPPAKSENPEGKDNT